MPDYLLLPATFLFSYLGTWLITILAHQRHWFDQPNSRSSHTRPTPTGGGLAFTGVFITAMLLAFAGSAPGFNYYAVLFLGLCIAALGLADDVLKLGIGPRILIQSFVAGSALALFGVPPLPLFGIVLEPGWPGYLLALLAFLWLINLFNFMDGIDGLAATETIFICMAVFVITLGELEPGLLDILLVLVAALCGFLLLNIAPAKIFMGDIGSNFLGFMLGVAALATTNAGGTSIWVWCILAGIFIVDASYTLLARLLAGETWYYAHRTHAYQLAANRYGSHGRVVLAVGVINCGWLLPLAWLCHTAPAWGLALTLIAWLPLLLITHIISRSSTFRQSVQ